MKRISLVRFMFGLFFFIMIYANGAGLSLLAQNKTPTPIPKPKTTVDEKQGQNPPKPNRNGKEQPSPKNTPAEENGNLERLQTEKTENSANRTESPKSNPPGDRNESSFLDSVTGILIWVGGAVAVLLLLGGIGYLIWRFVNGVNDRIGKLQLSVSDLSKSVQNLKTKNQELYGDLKNLAKQFQGQAGEISVLKHKEQSQSKPPDYQMPSPAASIPVFTPEPEFPVSVEEFLNKNGHHGIVAKFDYKTNLLIEDASGDGALIIVRDDNIPGGLLYVVPRFGLFKTKDDFYTHLERYYDCQNPRGGTVWIKEPSVVERDENGWTLREKGEIEVK